MLRCAVFKPGLVSYDNGLLLQTKAWEFVTSGVWDGILILLEHTPVITIGRSGGTENLLIDNDNLAKEGVDIFVTNRGGNITCHNPGQVVGYPILDLNKWQKDVHWYLRMVEEALIQTISKFGLTGVRKKDYTGVWLENEKIAAIGVAVKRWVTCHGFAFNVNNDLNLFKSIVPCGIKEFGVTSLAKIKGSVIILDVMKMLQEDFSQIFNCTIDEINLLGESI